MSPLFTNAQSGRAPRRCAGEVIARVVAAAGLAYDAYAHLDLAGNFDANVAVISQGMLFRVEAVVAGLAALLVLLTRRWVVVIFAVLVAGSALGAVLLYRYVDVGALGPLPDMYEPTWYPEKTWSAVAEVVAVIAAGTLFPPRLFPLRPSPLPTGTRPSPR